MFKKQIVVFIFSLERVPNLRFNCYSRLLLNRAVSLTWLPFSVSSITGCQCQRKCFLVVWNRGACLHLLSTEFLTSSYCCRNLFHFRDEVDSYQSCLISTSSKFNSVYGSLECCITSGGEAWLFSDVIFFASHII